MLRDCDVMLSQVVFPSKAYMAAFLSDYHITKAF